MIFIDEKDRQKKAVSVTVLGTWVNLVLAVGKFLAGYFGRSAAIIADGVHSLSDFFTDLVAIVSFKKAYKPEDANHNYGHGKFETLGGLIISVGLVVVGLAIFYSAIQKIQALIGGELINEPSYIALLGALVSIIVKEWLFRRTKKVGDEIDSRAVIANAWEHRSDALSSIGAFLGVFMAIVLGNEWVVLDPITAVVISLIILRMGIKLTHANVLELSEASLKKEENDKIIDIIKAVSGVYNPHNLCTRKIGYYCAIDVHVEIDKNMSVEKAHELDEEIRKKLRQEFGEETKINIHVDPKN